MRGLSLGWRQWIAEHIFGHAGIGTKMVQWQLRDSTAFPWCGQEEASRHVWTCHAPDAIWLWSQHIFKMETWLEQQDTYPNLQHEFINGLKAWSTGIPCHTFHCTPIHIRFSNTCSSGCHWVDQSAGGLHCHRVDEVSVRILLHDQQQALWPMLDSCHYNEVVGCHVGSLGAMQWLSSRP